jgi:hypothetical protein
MSDWTEIVGGRKLLRRELLSEVELGPNPNFKMILYRLLRHPLSRHPMYDKIVVISGRTILRWWI